MKLLLRFYDYIKANQLIISIIAFIFLLSYAQSAIDINYNNDGIERLIRPNGSWFDLNQIKEGFKIGRWFYWVILNCVNDNVRLPYLSFFFTGANFVISSILLWKIFSLEKPITKFIFGAFFCSSTLFVHYFFFSGDAEVYSFGILLIVISNYFSTKSRFGVLIATGLITLSFGCYPALFGFAMTLYCSKLVLLSNQGQKLSVRVLAKAFIPLISLLLYYLISKTGLFLLNIEMTDYRNANQITPLQLTTQLPDRFLLIFELLIQFISSLPSLIKIIWVIGVIGSSLQIFRKSAGRFLVLQYLLIISIWSVSWFSVYLITFDTKLYEGFILGTILITPVMVLFLEKTKNKAVSFVFVILTCVIITSNLRINNQIIAGYRMSNESSRILSLAVLNEILKLESYHEKSPVLFIGNVINNKNYTPSEHIPQTRLINRMIYPVSFTGENIPWNINNQIKLQGYKLNVITNLELKNTLEQYLRESKDSIPDFPKEGSVFMKSDTVYVNMGGYQKENN